MNALVGHFRHLDLFSGIGGFALAAEAAGWNTVGFAEVDDYASRVLKRHWPDVPNFRDVRNVPAMPVDLVTGGFPCQPFSHAGKQRGREDARYLWPDMLKVVQKCKPSWVLGENVPGIVNMELENVCLDLEAKGYEVWPLDIPACAAGAWHRRARIWIVAYAERVQPGAQSHDGPARRMGRIVKPVAWDRDWQDALREFRGVDDGLSYGVDRTDGLRNAIVPQVAYPLLRWMREGLCMANNRI